MHTVFGHEGGYNNDPNDYGGPTNMGITRFTKKIFKGME